MFLWSEREIAARGTLALRVGSARPAARSPADTGEGLVAKGSGSAPDDALHHGRLRVREIGPAGSVARITTLQRTSRTMAAWRCSPEEGWREQGGGDREVAGRDILERGLAVRAGAGAAAPRAVVAPVRGDRPTGWHSRIAGRRTLRTTWWKALPARWPLSFAAVISSPDFTTTASLRCCPVLLVEVRSTSRREYVRRSGRNDRAIARIPEITVSIGVATFPASADNVVLLFDAADEALARAQSQGRNQACIAPRRTTLTAGRNTALSCPS